MSVSIQSKSQLTLCPYVNYIWSHSLIRGHAKKTCCFLLRHYWHLVVIQWTSSVTVSTIFYNGGPEGLFRFYVNVQTVLCIILFKQPENVDNTSQWALKSWCFCINLNCIILSRGQSQLHDTSDLFTSVQRPFHSLQLCFCNSVYYRCEHLLVHFLCFFKATNCVVKFQMWSITA